MKKTTPILILHGGAGAHLPNSQRARDVRKSLLQVLNSAYEVLLSGGSAESAAVAAVQGLEDIPIFNAGKGSAIQVDGVIRMSSSLMSGSELCFSGVVNVRGIKNPILLSQALQKQKNRVLAGLGAYQFALKVGLKKGNPYTTRAREVLKRSKKARNGADTVGAVALDQHGKIAAATSTGGMSCTHPDRVSDSPTVAGNYANLFAGVSTTGIGEQITDHAVAAAIVTRVEDG
jgi:L-asparaginase